MVRRTPSTNPSIFHTRRNRPTYIAETARGYLRCKKSHVRIPGLDHNSLKKSNHISPTPSGSSPKTLQINFPNDFVFRTFACTQCENLSVTVFSCTTGETFRTQLAFKYSLSIFLTSGNRAVKGEQISVTTFSGVNEHLMCSSAAAFSSAISSPMKTKY